MQQTGANHLVLCVFNLVQRFMRQALQSVAHSAAGKQR
jgi:hypothetical protein